MPLGTSFLLRFHDAGADDGPAGPHVTDLPSAESQKSNRGGLFGFLRPVLGRRRSSDGEVSGANLVCLRDDLLERVSSCGRRSSAYSATLPFHFFRSVSVFSFRAACLSVLSVLCAAAYASRILADVRVKVLLQTICAVFSRPDPSLVHTVSCGGLANMFLTDMPPQFQSILCRAHLSTNTHTRLRGGAHPSALVKVGRLSETLLVYGSHLA